jgi:hypothetical protein
VVCQGDKKGVITSGGGFSEVDAQTSWQRDVVEAYFNRVQGTAKAPLHGYNPYGRGMVPHLLLYYFFLFSCLPLSLFFVCSFSIYMMIVVYSLLSHLGYPDISVLAHNYVITIGGNFTAVSGTSASAPVFAAFISLVNSERLKNGQPSVGWINPALYALSSTFVKDVTDGDNHCVAMGAICCSQGFSAVEGW